MLHLARKLPQALLVLTLAASGARAEDPGGAASLPAAVVPGAQGPTGEATAPSQTAPTDEAPTSEVAAPALPTAQRWAAGRDLFHAGRLDLAIPILRELAASSEVSAVERRDALHLLGWAELEAGRSGAASEAFARALALGVDGGAASALTDRMRLGYARALAAIGKTADALTELRRVEQDPSSPHREEAVLRQAELYAEAGETRRALREYEAFLGRWPEAPGARDAAVRAALLEIGLGRDADAARRLDAVLDAAPESHAGIAAAAAWAGLVARGAARARTDMATTVDLDVAEHLLRERFFDEAGAILDRALADAEARGAARTLKRVMELRLWHQRETSRWEEALATNAWLERHGGDAMSWYNLARAHAYAGDMAAAEAVVLERFGDAKSRGYYDAIADLYYEFGDYREAYRAYYRARQGVSERRRITDRMVWCMLRMGEADKAARMWQSAGSTRGKGRRLYTRYWYGRALTLSGDAEGAKTVFAGLVEDAPLDYYGVQAQSRLLELEGKAPKVDGSTVHWTEETAHGAFAEAPRRADQAAIEAALDSFADAWADAAPEARRAAELARLGFVDEAAGELRVIDMDIRSMRYGGSLSGRARADMLDNRRDKRARGGASIYEQGRKSAAAAREFRRNATAIRKALRVAQRALAEPYGLRRDAYESGAMSDADDVQGDAWRDAYPIAFPALVETFARQFEVPAYFVYGVMTVESAFHPHAISVSDAYGLLQMIPKTGRHVSDELGYVDFTPEILLRPEMSVYFGTYYLSSALKKFRGQEPLAAAAYNAGPHRVAAWLSARGEGPLDMFIEEIPFDQARNYTKSVLKTIARYRAAYHDDDVMYVSNHIERDHLAAPNY